MERDIDRTFNDEDQLAQGRAHAFNGRRLRLLRRRNGLTQSALAAAAAISRPSVTAYETGTAVPSPRVAAALAAALGVSIDHLTLTDADRAGLADLRYHAGLTQAQIAEHLGVSRNTFPGIERGERPPTPAQIAQLAELYSTTSAEILAAWQRTRATMATRRTR